MTHRRDWGVRLRHEKWNPKKKMWKEGFQGKFRKCFKGQVIGATKYRNIIFPLLRNISVKVGVSQFNPKALAGSHQCGRLQGLIGFSSHETLETFSISHQSFRTQTLFFSFGSQ